MNWKIGDFYTDRRYDDLRVIGMITQIGNTCVFGTEMVHSHGKLSSIGVERCYLEDQIVRLQPEPKPEPICRNPEENCQPPCPEHRPVDSWRDLQAQMSEEEHWQSLMDREV